MAYLCPRCTSCASMRQTISMRYQNTVAIFLYRYAFFNRATSRLPRKLIAKWRARTIRSNLSPPFSFAPKSLILYKSIARETETHANRQGRNLRDAQFTHLIIWSRLRRNSRRKHIRTIGQSNAISWLFAHPIRTNVAWLRRRRIAPCL